MRLDYAKRILKDFLGSDPVHLDRLSHLADARCAELTMPLNLFHCYEDLYRVANNSGLLSSLEHRLIINVTIFLEFGSVIGN